MLRKIKVIQKALFKDNKISFNIYIISSFSNLLLFPWDFSASEEFKFELEVDMPDTDAAVKCSESDSLILVSVSSLLQNVRVPLLWLLSTFIAVDWATFGWMGISKIS